MLKTAQVFLFTFLLSAILQAHPMDAANLNIDIQQNRALVHLKIHVLVVEDLLKTKIDRTHLDAQANALLQATLGSSQISVNNEKCEWRKPDLAVENVQDPTQQDYLDLSTVAVCDLPRVKTDSFDINLDFIKSRAKQFKLFVQLTNGNLEKSEFILDSEKTQVSVNAGANHQQFLFVRLGMAHIGADVGEWREDSGEWRWPSGLDHLLFIFALVLASATLLDVIKNATGFTIGHTLTLGLATFQIIHVHSHWVEAFIALSITLLILISLTMKQFKHGLLLNAVLGTVHGLGFSSVIHDLKLPSELLFPTLLSFNVGVEIGQIIMILIMFSILWLLQKIFKKHVKQVRVILSILILLISTYWFFERAF